MDKVTTKKGKSNLKLILGIFATGLLITGGAVMYGRNDQGVINVSDTIRNANLANEAAGGDTSNQVGQPGAAIFSTMPNGGLVGRGDAEIPQVTPPPVEEQSSTTSTTTEATDESGEATSETDDSEDTVNQREGIVVE